MKFEKKFNYIKYYRENGWERNGVSYSAFVSRVKCWWKLEDAVRYKAKKMHRRDVVMLHDTTKPESYYKIEIKYKNEEAIIIASVYENMIKELEDKYDVTDEPFEAHELLKKKQALEQEYEVFLTAQI